MHSPRLTVEETLQFSAALKGIADPTELINGLLEELKLDHVRHSLVGLGHSVPGETGRGLSGGESKRLSIAEALLKAPAMLFLDEHTVGMT